MPEAIRGLDELKRKMQALAIEGREGKKIFRAALRQAGNVIRDAARAKAPVKTGLLKRKIQTVSARGKPGTIRFQVRATGRRVSKKYPEGFPYGRAVEAGHGPPNSRGKQLDISKDFRSLLSKGSITFLEFGTGLIPPHPFMRPAWNESKEAALEKFGDEAGKRIEKLAGSA